MRDTQREKEKRDFKEEFIVLKKKNANKDVYDSVPHKDGIRGLNCIYLCLLKSRQ